MSQPIHGSAPVSASLASHSVARVVAVSAVVMVAAVAMVAVVAQPALAVAVAVAAAVVRFRRVVTVPVARRAHERLTAERGRPAAK
ncbi:hypothetical protein [Halosimplex pelagicum]|uniref:Uncharacterized protein n=1 Tax=Halosimplex pelagicum TaxID=869886 RepID=A0A7D5TG49_9EURY|nr:hypothetical protein [Halosimplex pelagicum]QLH81176.1 hypothetical protein HZS54_05765 [Halosimplex pelagicum]